ncbi:hypothetical protein F5X68DRAFT_11586 [Plectosphaerella plurivora]|uniref:Uncharacterized protein n=1 Tax=Plectosphaerella plurivora TaxID=936078 RepID=A0A9P9AC75_9PEZI|nr:hypothetical protein F5X68DRAFT_11586 [Plectosphaerella plurivora]
MLALRDENIVNAAEAARQVHGKSHLAPKTPGARFPKTPAKIPLNDENAVGGKTALKPKGSVNQALRQRNLVTPSETQSRAPLGNKTTNAKAKSTNILGDKTQQAKPTTIKKQRQKAASHDPLRVTVLNELDASEDQEVEFAPPRAKDLPYESDVFPDGTLTYEGLKQENLLKGYYNHFYNPIGQDGKRLLDRQHEESVAKALKQNDEDILRDIEGMDWSITATGTIVQKKKAPSANPTALQTKRVPLSSTKYPATINSRRAASALSMATGPTIRQKKIPEPVPRRRPVSALLTGRVAAKIPEPSKTAAADSAVAEAASRSTIGYTKGRSASSLLAGKAQGTVTSHGTIRPSHARHFSEATVRRDQPQPAPQDAGERQLPSRLQLLSIFDPEEEGLDLGATPDFDDESDDDFELKLA